MALKPNSKLVYDFVLAHNGEDITAANIAEGTGLPLKSVNGIITSAFQKKGLMYREEVAITGGVVKYVRLTEDGLNLDPDAE